jgi:succinate dehydrogenase/fumarate reductase flavoprotein subunit
MTDVVVAGFGPAGASAAIAAHDAGAHVTVLEKMPYGGGNALNSGGFLCDVHGPHAIDHLDALCFGKTPRDVLEAFAGGLHELPGWIETLGGATRELDVAAFGGMLPSWPHLPGDVTYRQFAAERPGPGLFALLRENVERRGIDVRYDTPAATLDRDCDRVVGVNGMRADAVVLAAGGFEYDAAMRDTYLPLPLTAVGHPGNTGDAIRLAQQAGADVWHMSAFFGWFAFEHPDHVAAFPLDVHAPSFIYVDGDGRRFADETGWEVHDRLRCLTAYLPRRPNRPRMPGWIVFDERARLAGPLNGIVGTPDDYTWSADNAAELAAGWIQPVEAVDAPELARTLREYGRTPDEFGRDPRTIVPLEPPLYAIQMRPGVATASGGPRRDARARAVRPDGTTVPGLYAVSGSTWGHLTEHGGGLTDAIVFGRIAGQTASS